MDKTFMCGMQRPVQKYYAKMTRQNVGNYPKYHQKIITQGQNTAVWHSPASGGWGMGRRIWQRTQYSLQFLRICDKLLFWRHLMLKCSFDGIASSRVCPLWGSFMKKKIYLTISYCEDIAAARVSLTWCWVFPDVLFACTIHTTPSISNPYLIFLP